MKTRRYRVYGLDLRVTSDSQVYQEYVFESIDGRCVDPDFTDAPLPGDLHVRIHLYPTERLSRRPFSILSSISERDLLIWPDIPVHYLCCSDRAICLSGEGIHAFIEPERRSMSLHIGNNPDQNDLKVAEFALAELLRFSNRHSVHAGSVHIDGRRFLVVGPSGAGKSTLCIAWGLVSGVQFCSDDRSMLYRQQNTIVSCGVSRFSRITAETLTILGRLGIELPVSETVGDKKYIVDNSCVFQNLNTVSAPVSGIILLNENLTEPFAVTQPEQILEDMFESSLYWGDPEVFKDHFDLLTDLLQQIDIIQVRARTDPAISVSLLMEHINGT